MVLKGNHHCWKHGACLLALGLQQRTIRQESAQTASKKEEELEEEEEAELPALLLGPIEVKPVSHLLWCYPLLQIPSFFSDPLLKQEAAVIGVNRDGHPLDSKYIPISLISIKVAMTIGIR